MSKEESKLQWVDPRLLAFQEDIIKMISECYDDELLMDIYDMLKERGVFDE